MSQKSAARRVGLWLPAFLVAASVGCRTSAQTAPAGPQSIHGYVVAQLNADAPDAVGGAPGTGIAVPDLEVVAKNTGTGATSAPVRTDPYGYFRTQDVPAGTYQICVSGRGFTSTCDPKTVDVADRVRALDHFVSVRTVSRAVSGAVRLSDKTTPCFWYDPVFGPAVMTAVVSLENAGGVVAGPVRANNRGEYLVPTTAAAGSYEVKAVCEAIQATSKVALTAASLAQDFLLSNGKPQVRLLEISKAGVGVRRASPGDTVQVTAPASDPDGDTLHYRWIDDSGRTTAFPDAPTVNWTPATGVQTLRVLISDGRGGYATVHTVLNVGPNAVVFSGSVYNRATNAAVPSASITLNTSTASTDANGRFLISVPDADRFVLNATKPGFALTSRIFYHRAVDIEVPLDPTLTMTVDGTQGGNGSVEVSGCVPPRIEGRGKGAGVPAVGVTRTERPCQKQTIGSLNLRFPSNALLLQGKAFNGSATVEALQFDLTRPNAIPGDQSGTYQGKAARLQTFGAFYIQPRDATGNPLQLAQGKAVDVSMPIHPLALGTAPATIPFFTYDEKTGLWVEHGQLQRIGSAYVGKITHFSSFNADTASAISSCLTIQLDPSTFPSAVMLNALYTNPAIGNFNHPNTAITDAHTAIVIERMVPSEDFVLEIRDNAAHAVLQTVTLNSGPPTTVTFPAPPPYTGCNGPITIQLNTVPMPPSFLTTATVPGNSADYKTATTTGFYAGRDTLPGWKSANGFPASGNASDEIHAVYFNDGDLKFGRQMHCRVTNAGVGSIGCYVSNFGSVGQDFSSQPTVLTDAYNNTNVVATVAMEYHPDQTDKVQFWAFKGDGSYLANPALDSQGGKPIPDICTACHQGSYSSATKLVRSAVFLPFDVDSFIGDDGNALHFTLGGGGQRPTQADFRQLNEWARQTSNVGMGLSPSIRTLTDLWYKDGSHPNGVSDTGATFHFNQGAAALPSAPFGTQPGAYDAVVKPACRMCHVARSSGFDTWDQLSQMNGIGIATFIQNFACNSRVMPHAEVPYKRFWLESRSSTLASELFATLTNRDCKP